MIREQNLITTVRVSQIINDNEIPTHQATPQEGNLPTPCTVTATVLREYHTILNLQRDDITHTAGARGTVRMENGASPAAIVLESSTAVAPDTPNGADIAVRAPIRTVRPGPTVSSNFRDITRAATLHYVSKDGGRQNSDLSVIEGNIITEIVEPGG